MIVNGKDIIEKQRSICSETRVDFNEHHHSILNPDLTWLLIEFSL